MALLSKIKPRTSQAKTSRYADKPMSRERFLVWQPPVDTWNYEFNQGIIELKARMKNSERYIVNNLMRCFHKTASYKKGNSLFQETDCWLTENQMRRPDVAYFTADQIRLSAQKQEPIPAFVVEMISAHDEAIQIEKKLVEYFEAGVQVVWHIYPDLKQIKVYTSLQQVKICYKADVCSASPAVPDLEISVDELFAI